MTYTKVRYDYTLQSMIMQEFNLKDKEKIVLMNPDLQEFLTEELIDAIQAEGPSIAKQIAYDSLFLLKKARVVSALYDLGKHKLLVGQGNPSKLEVEAMKYWNTAREIRNLLQ